MACCSTVRQSSANAAAPSVDAVRLQCVRRSTELLGVLPLERAPQACDQRWRIREEDVHDLREELDAAEVSQVLQSGSLES